MVGLNPSTIVVLRLRAFGDTVLTTPTLRGLKKAYPQARLSVVMETGMAQVLAGLPYIDEVITFDRVGLKARGPIAELVGTIRFWLELRRRRFDLALDVLGTPRTAMMTWMTRAPVRVGFGFRFRSLAYTLVWPPDLKRRYIADFTADLLRALGHAPDSLVTDFFIPETSQASMDAWLSAQGLLESRPIFVQGAGGWDLKRYPIEKIAQALAQVATQTGRRVVSLWGPGEQAMALDLVERVGKSACLAPATDFKAMGALLKRGGLLLTNDNATKHLAGAVGCPTVTVFGPTSDVAWHPASDPMHRSVRLDLDCMPCEAMHCRLGTHACMLDLEPQRVSQACLDLLARVGA